MAWIILVLAGLLEITWAIGLKYTEGFSKIWPSIITLVSLVGSVGLLTVALKSLPVGTAYPAWVGIGSIGTVIFGIVFLGEAVTIGRVISIVLVISGIIGLKICTVN